MRAQEKKSKHSWVKQAQSEMPASGGGRNLFGVHFTAIQQFVVFLAVFVLLNLPFWLSGLRQFMSRPWFNVDLLLPLVFFASRRYWIGAFLLAIFASADAASSLSRTFYFPSVPEFLTTIRYLPMLNPSGLLTRDGIFTAAGFSLIAALSAGSMAVLRPSRAQVFAMGMAVTLSAADALNGSSFVSTRATRLIPGNVAFSPIAKAAISMAQEQHRRTLQPLATTTASNAFVDIQQWLRSNPSRSVILVLVESWGVLRGPAVESWLNAQIESALPAAYNAPLRSRIAFNGPTTSAELRELCHLSGSYQSVTAASGATCLPARLQSLGWRTVGIHGFSGNMFDRVEWWPLIGIGQPIFAEQLVDANTPRCGGAFSGACDSQVIDRAFAEAAKGPSFIYLLTLNSHLPLAPRSPEASLARACSDDGVSADVCNLSSQIGNVMRGIASGLRKFQADPPLLIVVGDHAPPFGEKSARVFYDSSFVPAFALVPR